MRYYSKFLISLVCILLNTSCAAQYSGKAQPTVNQGVIDLSDWDFTKDGPVKLRGEWLFSWKNFIAPASWDSLEQEMIHRQENPGLWHNYEDPTKPGYKLPGVGFSTYAVKLEGVNASRDLAYLIVGQQFAAETFILDLKGNLINKQSRGIVSDIENEEIPIYDMPNMLETVPGDQVLFFYLSNFHYPRGGTLSSISLGLEETLAWQLKYELVVSVLMAGVLLIIGLSHLILFSFRKNDQSTLYFGLFALVIFSRMLSMGIVQQLVFENSFVHWRVFLAIEFLSMPLGLMVFIHFLNKLIEHRFLKNLAEVFTWLGLPLACAVIFTKPIFFGQYLYLYQIHVLLGLSLAILFLIYMSIRRDTFAIMALFVLFLGTIGIVNDILYARGVLSTGYIAPYTMLAFILFQSGIISYKNAKAYKTAEYLSDNLKKEVTLQTNALSRIQFLSQEIQNKSTLFEIEKNLKNTLRREYGIQTFIFYVVNDDGSELFPYSISLSANNKVELVEKLKKINLDLTHTRSTYAAVIRRQRSLFLPRLRTMETEPREDKVRSLLLIKSMYLVPLKVGNEVFAVFSLSDTTLTGTNNLTIRNLSKNQRKGIEQLSNYVSAALYQSLQQEKVKRVQALVSKAKSEVSMNQLAAHLAHEINNPLNYIASGKTTQSESFFKYHEMVLSAFEIDDPDSQIFKTELESLYKEFDRGLEQTEEGQARIAKVIAEIRAISGVDGLIFSNIDMVPIINEELIYSLHRNQVKSGEQSVRVTGTNEPLMVLSNPHILARSIRTVLSNCIHFARAHKGNAGELEVDCFTLDNRLLINIGNNSFSIKNENLSEIFDLEQSKAYGTEQIGLAMVKELLQKIKADLVLADHGRESGRVVFQLQVPL